MTKTLFSAAAALLLLATFSAQEKVIDTVFILDKNFENASRTQQIYKITAADFTRNSTNLSELLRFQTPVYIKENGLGAVSSPSFRGTTAQQTAFVWNGININSVFLGQGDVNNIGLFGFDEISVKSGGGSVVYGGGAIGGTVHLHNEIRYNQGWKSRIFLEGGSFSSLNSMFKTGFSDEKLSFSFSGSHSQSRNGYEVPEKFYVNRNGQFHNTNLNFGIGYKLNSRSEIFWQSQFYDGLQHFPTSSENGTKTMYRTDNFRSLLGWNFNHFKIKNQLAAAYLEEDFGYFANIEQPQTSGGIAKSFIFKDDFTYFLSKNLALNFLGEFRKTQAEGLNSGIINPERNSGSVALLLKYQADPKLYVEAGLKKEIVEGISTPTLYSAAMQWKAADFYTMKFNASKNFRYPDFNDLYWQPGGNPDLKSETSYQGELGNEFKYKNLELKAVPYLIYIENMIQWVPTNLGYWQPNNFGKVRSFGIESQLRYRLVFNDNIIDISGGYIFTNSKNMETRKQLMYVPRHKFFANAGYRYKNLGIFLQGMFNGLTYSTSDESMHDALKPYFVLNGGADYSFFKKYQIGFKVKNITNQIYETTSYFPLPKRNYNLYLDINF